MSGVVVSLLLVCMGWFYALQHEKSYEPPHNIQNKTIEWIGRVDKVSYRDNLVYTVEIEVAEFKEANNWEPKCFKILVYNKDSALTVGVGDFLAAKSTMRNIDGPILPTDFNYRAFLSTKSIFLKSYASSFYRQEKGFSLVGFADEAKQKIQLAYKSFQLEPEQLAVLSALTLGDKSGLTTELRAAYAGAGAMHILAVSGLHVGIIFLIINTVLRVFPNNSIWSALKTIIVLSAVWGFALLAGFSSSVQRASWMLSFIILSGLLKRGNQTLNSIAASALLLVLIDPNALFQLGFQLSYAAVLGIVLIYPPLSRAFKSSYWLVNQVWSLFAVSTAAQLATAPITMYYFHQFPNLFLFTNLIVIPLAFAVVIVTIPLLLIYFSFSIDFGLSYVLRFLLKLLNQSMSYIEQLSFAVTRNIWLDGISVALLFTAIILLIHFLYRLNYRYLTLSLSALLLLVSIKTIRDFLYLERKEVIFYTLQSDAIAVIHGLTAIVHYEDNGINNRERINNHLYNLGVKEIKWEAKVQKNVENQLIEIEDILLLQNPTLSSIQKLSTIPDYIIDWNCKTNRVRMNESVVHVEYCQDVQYKQLDALRSHCCLPKNGMMRFVH